MAKTRAKLDKSKSSSDVDRLIYKLKEEIDLTYKGLYESKNDLINAAGSLRRLKDKKENYPKIRQRLGALLIHTDGERTTAAIITQLLLHFTKNSAY